MNNLIDNAWKKIQEQISRECKITIASVLAIALLIYGWIWHPIIWGTDATTAPLHTKDSLPQEIPKNQTTIPNILKPKKETPATIMIYVTGAVKKPGVYTLKEGSRGVEAIKLAGGIIPKGDLTRINLAKKLKDEEMIVVPIIEPVPSIPTPIYNNRRPNINQYGSNVRYQTAKFIDKPVSINKASFDELKGVPGVTPRMAEKILEVRNEKGNFSSIDELKTIPGIRAKLFDRIKNYLTL